jgi:hypothetical protein
LEALDQTPKTTSFVVAGRTVTTRYTGAKQYALKLDVRVGERVGFEPVSPAPAFYAIGQAGAATRLIKLADVSAASGAPQLLTRPGATAEPVGDHVATGWLGPGAPYASVPPGAYEQRSNTLTSDGANNLEVKLRDAGEAVMKLRFADGRALAITTAWRSDDLENWRTRNGETPDRALLDDLAERLTQLLHEQGVAAGVDVWENGADRGLSFRSGDFVAVEEFSISGAAAALTAVDPSGMVGGLRGGVAARRFDAVAVAASGANFVGAQSFSFTTAVGVRSITIPGGSGGIDAAALVSQLNGELQEQKIAAAASLVDVSGSLTLRIDALHDVLAVDATINGVSFDADLLPPGAWAMGGLPTAAAGQPFGDAVRTSALTGGPPLLAYPGAIDLELVIDTPAGAKTVTISVSAAERADDPDPAAGEWSGVFQARLDAALNEAGVYVGVSGTDLVNWSAGEAAGHRVASISINGDMLALQGVEPMQALGGAFSVERSFTSASAADAVDDDAPDLLADQVVELTFATVWGERVVSTTLQAGDARNLESVALRLNEALAAAGYDLGVAAVGLSGGGAGLRIVSGTSHTVRGDIGVALGGVDYAVTLDPIDSASRVDDPVGTEPVAQRAARGAAATETPAKASTLAAPSANASAWFPGRAWDVAVGENTKIAQTRAVAAGGDGSVYVLADLGGDSETSAIKGARDVALFKYDSAGNLAYTHYLGASHTASGFALAVSSGGAIALAGAVEGALSNAGAAPQGGRDSFVTLLDARGNELWTVRRAAAANDEAAAVAFAPDGGVIVAGRTESALTGATALGGADAYVRGFSAAGVELFSHQFGTSGADDATALLSRDDGAGGVEFWTAGTENDRGVVRRFSYSSAAGFAVGVTRDIGHFYKGTIAALAADGASLYIGGEVGADRVALGATAHAAVSGQEGFVARLNADLTDAGLDRVSYLGSAKDDAVRGLTVVGGEVYVAGVAGSSIAGQGGSDVKSSFFARLDAAGSVASMRTFNSAAGGFRLAGLATDASGASPLDVLGLPRGIVSAEVSAPLVSRSALRVGDEFQIGALDGRLVTVKVAASETLGSLAGAIGRAIGAAGRAQVVREDGVERLRITSREGRGVRIEKGRDGRDALPALGLSSGLVAVAEGAGPRPFGLGLLAGDLKLGSRAEISKTKAELSAAVSLVRQAYEALLYPHAKEQSEADKALAERRRNAGEAPDHYRAQLANYQAALARLGG